VTVGRRPRAFWRTLDALDYWLTLTRLRILDALAGPEPETPADQRRKQDRERLDTAFPRLGSQEPGVVISQSDRLRERD
jgi:hypothetical protein